MTADFFFLKKVYATLINHKKILSLKVLAKSDTV